MEMENKMIKKKKSQKFTKAIKFKLLINKTSQLNHDLKCKQKQHTRRCK